MPTAVDDYGNPIGRPDLTDASGTDWSPVRGSIPGLLSAITSRGIGLYRGSGDLAPTGPGLVSMKPEKPKRDPYAPPSRLMEATGPSGPGAASTEPGPITDPYTTLPEAKDDPYTKLPHARVAGPDEGQAGPTGSNFLKFGMKPQDFAERGARAQADAQTELDAQKQADEQERQKSKYFGLNKDSLLAKFLGGVDENRGTLAALAQGFLNHGLRTNSFSGMPQAALADRNIGERNMTIDALMKRGMDKGLATAMSGNPAALSALLGQISGTSKRYQPIQLADSLGNHHLVIFDPDTGQIVSKNSAGGGEAGGVGDLSNIPIQIDPKTGRDENFAAAFKAQDPVNYSAVDALLRGDINAAGRNTQKLIPYASRIEPGFDMTMYKKRQDAQKYWEGGGKGDETIKRLDQATQHFVDWAQSADKQSHLPGGALINRPLNEAGTLIGTNTDYGPFKTNTHGLADELAGIWKGANLSDTEIRAWGENFPLNGTLAQQKAYTNKLLDMIEGGQNALEGQRQRDFGASEAARRPMTTSPETRTKLAQLRAWANNPEAKMPREGERGAPAMNAPVERVLQEAREAIKQGAPVELVIERLRKNGIDPSKL